MKKEQKIIGGFHSNRRKSFFRGILFGIAITAFIDILFVHLLLKSHRIYERPSVNIVEPIIVVIALIVIFIILKKEGIINPKIN